MGTDNSHFKSHRRNGTLKRKSKNRQPFDRVLIICEGSKTEPYYFNALCQEEKISSVVIEPCSLGTDPLNIVNDAIAKYEEHKNYERVYCVFDKENNNYQNALDRVKAKSKKDIPIYATPSVPCFEYWLLLHFEETAKPYSKKGKKSAGAQVISQLKKYIKDYDKADHAIFEKTKSKLPTAIKRAKSIEKRQVASGTDNPSTKIYKLVEYLRSIKKSA